jgi:uncharacterized membrane protein YkvA (DUF1232 family)
MAELEERYVKQGAKKVKERDFQKVVNKGGQILNKFVGRSLGRFFTDARLLLALVRDFWTKKYRLVPYGIVAAIVFALIYVANPLDIIPDFLPFIGEIDDAAIFGACLILVERDLRKYQEWREGHLLKG